MVAIGLGRLPRLFALFVLAPTGCGVQPESARATVSTPARFERLAAPGDDEWRALVPERPQGFDEFAAECVNRKSARRFKIYLQPLGLMEAHAALLEEVRAYAEAFFGVPAVVLPKLPTPAGTFAPRRGQYDAHQVIERLVPQLPRDALALMGVMEEDLFAGDFNFVFGKGDFDERTGVYSLARLRSADPVAFLRRALALTAHETGHILGMRHCVEWHCLMQGASSLFELDRHPLHLCLDDLRKLVWNTGVDPIVRYRRLVVLLDGWGIRDESEWTRGRLALQDHSRYYAYDRPDGRD
jgi:archaemetzincin